MKVALRGGGISKRQAENVKAKRKQAVLDQWEESLETVESQEEEQKGKGNKKATLKDKVTRSVAQNIQVVLENVLVELQTLDGCTVGLKLGML